MGGNVAFQVRRGLNVNFTFYPCEHIHVPVNLKIIGCSMHIVSLIKYVSCSICFVPSCIC